MVKFYVSNWFINPHLLYLHKMLINAHVSVFDERHIQTLPVAATLLFGEPVREIILPSSHLSHTFPSQNGAHE